MLVLACGVGFAGPFGTYVRDRLADRVGTWWLLLIGAYLLVRPAIILLRRFAKMSELSPGAVVFWGVALCSIPLAATWRSVGKDAFRDLDGYARAAPVLHAVRAGGLGRLAVGGSRRPAPAMAPPDGGPATRPCPCRP